MIPVFPYAWKTNCPSVVLTMKHFKESSNLQLIIPTFSCSSCRILKVPLSRLSILPSNVVTKISFQASQYSMVHISPPNSIDLWKHLPTINHILPSSILLMITTESAPPVTAVLLSGSCFRQRMPPLWNSGPWIIHFCSQPLGDHTLKDESIDIDTTCLADKE